MTKTNIILEIANEENLKWAWKKVKSYYHPTNSWMHQQSLSMFESNLETNLQEIKKGLLNHTYKPAKIKPIALPKSKDNKGKTRSRQSFWFQISDQIVWVAICNIIGPLLDTQMPSWSYGHRLYVNIFPEDKHSNNDSIKWKFGFYRHTSKNIYRKWTQSWPRYRKHIALTCKLMANTRSELTEDEEVLLTQNESSLNTHQVPYISKDYWGTSKSEHIYFAGIDFKKFYPSIKLNIIYDNIINNLPPTYDLESLKSLLTQLLVFEIDSTGWNKLELSKIDLKDVVIFNGLPTGLIVDGFLANVALLEVDKKVSTELQMNKNIAHFKFVDDHVILSRSFEELTVWIKWYTHIINESSTNITINCDKTEPPELQRYLNDEKSKNKISAEKSTKIDPQFPTPLMTKTLLKVSMIAKTDFDLLDSNEQHQIIADLEHILVTEFPDHELRKETRISFAASKLAALVPKQHSDIFEIIELQNNKHSLETYINKLEKEIKLSSKDDTSLLKQEHISKAQDKIKEINKNVANKQKEAFKKKEKLTKHTNKLLLRAIKKNYDKPKLWARYIEFNRREGIYTINNLFSTINNLKYNKQINTLTATYLVSFITQSIVEQLFIAYKISNSEESTFHEYDSNRSFIIEALKINNIKRVISELEKCKKKFYSEQSHHQYIFSIGCMIEIINKDDFTEFLSNDNDYKEYRLQWTTNKKEIKSSKIRFKNIGLWFWWSINKIQNITDIHPHSLWQYFMKNTKLLTDNEINTALLFPSAIKVKYLSQLTQTVTEGTLFEILYANKDSIKKEDTVPTNTLDCIAIINANHSSLFEWNDWIKDRIYKNNYDDPRVSEWTALEIVKQIAKNTIQKDFSSIDNLLTIMNSDTKLYHPSAYVIPKEWITDEALTWERWKIATTKHQVKCSSNYSKITDTRYMPAIYNANNNTNPEWSIINGIGVILLNLLRNSFTMPSIKNPNISLRDWQNHQLYNFTHPVSWYSMEILKSCFSIKNIETNILNNIQKNKIAILDDDTKHDPIVIDTVQSLIDRIEKAQDLLTKYQLTIREQQCRQIIPCNTMQYSKNELPFPLEKEQ